MMWDVKSHGVNDHTMMNLGELAGIQFNGCKLPTDSLRKGYLGQGGVRFGTNIITARGYQPEDCREVARFLNELAIIGTKVHNSEAAVWNEALSLQELSDEVEKFAVKFPLPGVTSKYIY
jgi:glycine/serine hydroxymethyltransferase